MMLQFEIRKSIQPPSKSWSVKFTGATTCPFFGAMNAIAPSRDRRPINEPWQVSLVRNYERAIVSPNR